MTTRRRRAVEWTLAALPIVVLVGGAIWLVLMFPSTFRPIP